MANYLGILEGITSGLEAGQRFRANKQFERAREQQLEVGEYELEGRRRERRTALPKVFGESTVFPEYQPTLQDPFGAKMLGWFKNKIGARKKRAIQPLGMQGEEFGPPSELAQTAVGTGDEEFSYGTEYADGGRIAKQGDMTEEEIAEAEAYIAEQRRPRRAIQPEMSDEEVAATTEYIYNQGRPARQPEMTEEEAQAERDYISAQQRRRPPLAQQDPLSSEGAAAERAYIARQEADRTGRAREKQRVANVDRINSQLARNGGVTDEDIRLRGTRERDRGQIIRSLPGLDQAVNSAMAPVLGPNFIPRPESRTSTGGFRTPRNYPGRVAASERRRTALPPADAGEPAAAPAGVTSPPAAASPAAGSPRAAAPPAAEQPAAQPKAQTIDFSQLDVDAKEVPNMTTDDWKRYRFELMEAARATGRPEAVKQANDMVTQMQMEGFLSYGQQGLALQEAGNAKGAMAAYRAAFQYFPNGNDVEFGLVRDRDGKPVIVGFGKDEQTGKRVEGSEIVMDPQRVSRLIENFQNPAAFRAWTKDWRDFDESKRRFGIQQAGEAADRSFRTRRYEEVEKPTAQAQIDALATNAEANLFRAENSMRRGLTDTQRSEAAFRQAVEYIGFTDPRTARRLAALMSQFKERNPGIPDNVIVDALISARDDGTLDQKLKALGIQ